MDQYTIRVVCPEKYRVGNISATLLIQLVGARKKTVWHKLNEPIALQAKKTDIFLVAAEKCGRLEMIRLKLDFGGNPVTEWRADYVSLSQGGRELFFPFYEFISTDIAEIVPARACIPQNVDSDIRAKQRKDEIEHNESKYNWNTKPVKGEFPWGLPRLLKAEKYSDIPKELHAQDLNTATFMHSAKLGQENIEMQLKRYPKGMDCLNAYKNLFSHPEIPGELPDFINKAWDTDKEFGRQILNGINPTVLERSHGLPDGCLITDEQLANSLEGNSFANAARLGRMYMVNYFNTMKGVKRNTNSEGKQFYAPDCLCLLYSTNGGDLLPVAIQLEANNPASIFTPNDAKYDWLLAKMYFRCTDANYHEWLGHLVRTHMVIEPTTVALFRCLPRSHPVYKLLRPHLRTAPEINFKGRPAIFLPNALLPKTLATDAFQTVKKYFAEFSFDSLNIPELLKNRGLLDKKSLKNFHYRDDLLELWNIVGWFNDRVIRHYYKTDQDVVGDFEIQSWISEIANEGFGWMDGNTRGVPTRFNTVDELVEFCTTLMATCTIQHSAVNFGQYDIYKYVPNAPFGMRMPIHKKGEGSLERILNTLPNVMNATIQICCTFQLSEFAPNEIYFGEFPDKLFNEEWIDKIRERLSVKLMKFSERVTERNKDLEYPYEYLLPERIAASVAV